MSKESYNVNTLKTTKAEMAKQKTMTKEEIKANELIERLGLDDAIIRCDLNIDACLRNNKKHLFDFWQSIKQILKTK